MKRWPIFGSLGGTSKPIIILSIMLSVCLSMESFAFTGAKYEPPDGRVIHGLGQYVSYLYTDAENWQFVNEYQNAVGKIPVIYSAYTYLDPFLDSVDTTDLLDIVTNHSYPYVLLVGLSLFDYTILTTGTTNIPVQAILSGGWDGRIIDIANRIKAANVPVFLRPGYEFGNGNSGIHNDPDVGPTTFKNIWIYIYNIFQQENVTNAAWVWNTVNPHQFNYMSWYPGDNYVDWWGINYFTTNQMNNGDGFLNNAAQRNKPVIVCESNPIQNGGTTNSSNWNNWFVPYFQKINSNTHIKAFVYVSDPWDRGLFSNWPDSRITSNSLIQNNYAQEMTDSVYIHMDEYLANPGIIGACTSGLLGDIDGDGMVNSTDALIALSFDAGYPIPQPFMDRINLGFGDGNEDGLTNSTDALLILSFDSGIAVQFPVGHPTCL